MHITMLGSSGSGKTVYMSAMSELFYNGRINGYSINNRNDNFESSSFVFKYFSEINTLYQEGSFPEGTSSNILMPLRLDHNGFPVINIDWIDYRGGAIKELASGNNSEDNAQLLAILLASDVILVFVDAAVLKVCSNTMQARARVGANEISQILVQVAKKKHTDIIFLLSKADSSIIDIKQDSTVLKEKLSLVYTKFFSDTKTCINNYYVIPVGAVGCGNAKTTYEMKPTPSGGKKLVFKNELIDFENMHTVNIASSFARSLLLCLESEINRRNIEAKKLADELEGLTKNFGPLKNLIDILFNNSKRRTRIFKLETLIQENRGEILKLAPHRSRLEEIARGNA